MSTITRVAFLMLLFSMVTASEVSIVPNDGAVAAINGDVAFTCIPLSLTGTVEWLINGTLFDQMHLSGVTQEHRIILQFQNVTADLNNSKIQCRDSGQTSPNSRLLVQGFLGAVESLQSVIDGVNVQLTWLPPFTLNITRTSVGITYCVDVVSSTSSATLHSECGIKETEFTYPLSWCDKYAFTVTPVNVAGPGAEKSVNFSHTLPCPELNNVTTSESSVTFLMSAPVCDVILTLVNTDTGEKCTLGGADLNIADTNITFPTEHLSGHYIVKLSAYNIGGHSFSEEEINITYAEETTTTIIAPTGEEFGIAETNCNTTSGVLVVRLTATAVVMVAVVVVVAVMVVVAAKKDYWRRKKADLILISALPMSYSDSGVININDSTTTSMTNSSQKIEAKDEPRADDTVLTLQHDSTQTVADNSPLHASTPVRVKVDHSSTGPPASGFSPTRTTLSTNQELDNADEHQCDYVADSNFDSIVAIL